MIDRRVKIYITSKLKELPNGKIAMFEGPRIYAESWELAEHALKQVDPYAWIEGVLLEEVEYKQYYEKNTR